jgi:hypothetical protein
MLNLGVLSLNLHVNVFKIQITFEVFFLPHDFRNRKTGVRVCTTFELYGFGYPGSTRDALSNLHFMAGLIEE